MVYVRWYTTDSLSYRYIEEMIEERGISVDHSTVNHWARRLLPVIERLSRKHRRQVGASRRTVETYKVKGFWRYLYRAVHKEGKTIDFVLGAHRDIAAAKRLLEKAMREKVIPPHKERV